jgi:hypothetical protein
MIYKKVFYLIKDAIANFVISKIITMLLIVMLKNKTVCVFKYSKKLKKIVVILVLPHIFRIIS